MLAIVLASVCKPNNEQQSTAEVKHSEEYSFALVLIYAFDDENATGRGLFYSMTGIQYQYIMYQPRDVMSK